MGLSPLIKKYSKSARVNSNDQFVFNNGIKKLSHSKVYKIKIQCAKANQT